MDIYQFQKQKRCKRFRIKNTVFDKINVIIDVQQPFDFDISTETMNEILNHVDNSIKNSELIIILELNVSSSNHIYTNKKLIDKLDNCNNYIIASKDTMSGGETLSNILPHLNFKSLTFFGGYISQCLLLTVVDTLKLIPNRPIDIPLNACFEEHHKNIYESVELLEKLKPAINLTY